MLQYNKLLRIGEQAYSAIASIMIATKMLERFSNIPTEPNKIAQAPMSAETIWLIIPINIVPGAPPYDPLHNTIRAPKIANPRAPHFMYNCCKALPFVLILCVAA